MKIDAVMWVIQGTFPHQARQTTGKSLSCLTGSRESAGHRFDLEELRESRESLLSSRLRGADTFTVSTSEPIEDFPPSGTR